mgnify:CR=1 FL=1
MSIAPHIHADATALAASLGMGFSGLVSRLILEALGAKKSLLQQDAPCDTAFPTGAQIAQAMDYVQIKEGQLSGDAYAERDALRAALAFAEKAHADSTAAALFTQKAMAFVKKAQTHVTTPPPTPHF